MGRISGRNLDAFRHALGRLDRGDYLEDGYFGRWLNAAELMLTDSAILAPGAVDARVRANQGEQVEQPPAPGQDAKPDYKPTAAGSLRPVDEPPRFAVGDRVRVADEDRPGHTQRVGYLRGRTGTVAGCYLRHTLGLAGTETLAYLKELTGHNPDAFWPAPEMQEQRAFVERWTNEL